MPLQLEFRVDDKATPEIKKLQRDLAKLKPVLKDTEQGFGGLNKNLVSVAGNFVSLYAIMGVGKAFVQQADKAKLLNTQLKLVTKNTQELYRVEAKLFDLAQDTRQSLDSTVNLYARLARASKSLGTSQTDLMTVTGAVNKALIISGATAMESSSAITQLSQGIASGVLRGEEFNSIMENGSRVADALADSLGVTKGELRALAQEGKLTSEVVMKALIEQSSKLNEEYKKMPPTVGQAVTTVGNEFTKLAGIFDKTTGASNILVASLSTVNSVLEKMGWRLEGVSNEFGEQRKQVLADLKAQQEFLDNLRAKNKSDAPTSAKEALASVEIKATEKKSIDDIKKYKEKQEQVFLDWKYDAIQTSLQREEDLAKESANRRKEAMSLINQEVSLQFEAFALITPEIDKVNDKFLEIYERMQGIFSTEQMEAFFEKWQESAENVADKQDKYEGIGSKAWTAGLKGQSKGLANIGNAFEDLGKEQKKWDKFSKENNVTEKDKHQHLSNQLSAYGNIAGAVSDMYADGSSGAEAMMQVQRALAIVEGGLAVVHQMTSGDVYTAIPRAMAVAATVASFVDGFSGSGASSIAPTVGSTYGEDSQASMLFGGINKDTTLEQALEELTSTIEVQNQLFKASGLYGGEFANDLRKNTIDLLKAIPDAWADATTRFSYDGKYEGSFDVGALTTTERAHNISTVRQYDDLVQLVYALSDWSIAFPETKAGIHTVDGRFATYLADMESSFTVLLDEYTTNLLDMAEAMDEYRDSWIEIYEGATADNKFTSAELSQAMIDVNSLASQIGATSYTDMLEQLINVYKIDYDKLREAYADSDPTVLINELQSIFPKAEFNPENVYNFIDAIELVGEMSVASTENIATWTQRNETAEDTARRLSEQMGVVLVGSMEELDTLAQELIESNKWLTDAELELLEANEAYLESINETTMTLKGARDIVGDDIIKQWTEAENRFKSLSRTFTNLGENIEDTIVDLMGLTTNGASRSTLLTTFWAKQEEIDRLLSGGQLSTEEETRLKDLVGDVNQLSKNIQKATFGNNELITNQIVAELEDLSRELTAEQGELSVQDKIDELTQTAINYLGADSDIVEWLKSIEGAISGIDFATYEAQKELERAYLLLADELRQKPITDTIRAQPTISGSATKTVASVSSSPEAQILDLYQEYGFTPDTAGVQYWVNDLSSGQTLADIEKSFATIAGLDGSHANGLSYVPFDGYRAELHRGERVLTASENQEYNNSDNTEQRLAMIEAVLTELLKSHKDSYKLLQRVENNGLIAL